MCRVRWIGYVKLLDERDCAVPLREQHRALNRQSGSAKVAILAAGPVMNFVFAVLAYWCMFVIGVPGARPVVGEIESGSIAAAAGLAPATRSSGSASGRSARGKARSWRC